MASTQQERCAGLALKVTSSMAHTEATLQQWVDGQVRVGTESVQKHLAAVKAKAPQLEKMEDTLRNLCLEQHRIGIACDKENLESEMVKMSIQQAKGTAESLSVDIKELQKHREKMSTLLVSTSSDQDSALAEKSKITHELQRSVSCYQRLGLDMQRDGEHCLHLTFTLIDSRDHHRKFEFGLHITDENLFQMNFCTPALPEANQLVRMLNKDGNFAGFVLKMRVGFKTFVAEEKAKGV